MSSYTKNKLEYLKGTKQLIREAIEEKGQTVTDGDSFRSYVDKIANIKTGVDVSGVTATAPHVLEGDVFVDADGNPVNGTMKNNGAVLKKLRYIGYDKKHTYTIPEGYHDGTGIVEVECDSEQIVYPSKYRQRLYGTPIRDNDWNLTGYNFLGHVVIDPIPDQYQDVTPVTATAEDVRAGKVFVDAQGNAVEGALSGTIADVSGVTATAADVRQGKVIVDAQGNEVVGTLVVEQKAPDVIWVGKDSVSNAQVGTGVVRYVTFMNDDGTAVYGQKSVLVGTDCIEPVAGGYMDAPTKESTAEHTFTFSGGWATEPNGGKDSNALKNVTEDRTVYANFIAAVRYYTVTYYDSDGTTVLKTESLAYGATPSYKPTSANYMFAGWVPEAATVAGDASYTATWKAKPAFATASWADIKAAADAGEASAAFKVGDTKTVILTFADGTKENVTWRIVDIRDQFVYSPSLIPQTQDAKLAIMADHAIARYGTVRAHNKMSYNGFNNTELSNTLNGEFYNALPAELQGVIYQTNNCKLGKVFIPHSAELNLESGGVYDFGTFEYFKTDTTNRVIRKLGAEGSATAYWTRTFKNSGSSTRMKTVTATGLLSGTKESNGGTGNFSVVPMFLI